MQITRFLEKLHPKGLSHLFFFFHAAWPWLYTIKGRNTRRKSPEIVEGQTTKVDRWLEQKAMGKGYDSVSLGKKLIKKSQWLKKSESWCYKY